MQRRKPTKACGQTEPPPTKVEGFSGLERLRRTVGSFPTEVGGFKPDFWKMKAAGYISFKATQTVGTTMGCMTLWPDVATMHAAIDKMRAGSSGSNEL
jgi:hypothetical protein